MLSNNYIQVLHILETEAAELAHDLEQFNLTESDLEATWVNQARHFKELGKETLGMILYNIRIQEPEDFEQLPPHSSTPRGYPKLVVAFLEKKRDNVLWEILQMESQMDVTAAMDPLDSEYKVALKYD
ncbi:uncharacterized protein C8R40DRAFT_1178951 [Lentinula edodes]|uniref:uncharacterized protein n=1 Tax=Lentinula edodes TaxID=5353 RepID=UPI001E8D8B93|nr:uncharacterized protein C8R40DRAFT_1178951 [Lentinula edodes]KAH7867618.1 hypothetical protein C8R40DRAFT_1178951 [Lentinula edodes]